MENRALPLNCLGVLGLAVMLLDQLTCWCSHHSLVCIGSLPSSCIILQSTFISDVSKMSNSHLFKPYLIKSSLNLPFLEEKPPMFWNPILRVVSFFNCSSSPNFPVKESLCSRSPLTSVTLLSSEASSSSVLTMAGGPCRAAGWNRLWVVGLFRLIGWYYDRRLKCDCWFDQIQDFS